MSSQSLSSLPKSIAIVGAGLGGLVLALALHKYGIPTTMYEMREPGVEGFDIGGAIMLSPNALRVLDTVDMYERLRTKGYNFETLTLKSDHDFKTSGIYHFGDEKRYGYKALRIYRRDLVIELQKAVQERGVPILFGRKYSHVVSETDEGVTFAFADGTTTTAELLIGVDGIHSKVRQYLFPDIVPKYAGFIGVTYAFPTANLRLPQGQEDFPFPTSISGKNGAFVMAPQNVDGKEMFVGRQFKYPLQDRSGWNALLKSRAELAAMHQEDMKQWSDLVQSAQEQASTAAARTFNIWPYHVVPHMDSWASQRGNVIILGDAAHAIPPTAGQGANQAAEDALSLAFLLKNLSPTIDLAKGLKIWQNYRQERIAKVMHLNDLVNITRMTEEERFELKKAGGDTHAPNEGFQLEWLYSNVVEDDMANELAKAN